MRARFLGQCFFLLACFFVSVNLSGQTTIFNEIFNEGNGATSGTDVFFNAWNVTCPTCDDYYEVRNGALEQRDSDGPTTFVTGNMDISACNTLTFSMQYTGGPWPGSGNFEGADECGACLGDTDNPLQAPCSSCWDFTLVELVYNNGSREQVEFIGEDSNDPVPSNISHTTPCIGNLNTARIEIKSQTWDDDEITTYDNIMLVCNDPISGLGIDQIPLGAQFCVGDQVELEVRNPAGLSIEWFDPDDNPIGSGPSITFAALLSMNSTFALPRRFTALATDASGCTSIGTWGITVNAAPDAVLPGDITVCEGSDFLIEETGGDATMWTWNGTYPGTSTSDSWNLTNLEPIHSGAYTVTISNAADCDATAFFNLTVEPGGALNIPSISAFCENDMPRTLTATVDGVPGTWSGTPISGNVLDPSIGSGIYSITFTPNSVACLSPQMVDITVNAAPPAFLPSMSLETCGGPGTTFDLTTVDNEISGGSGQVVLWYEDLLQSTPITSPMAYLPVVTTVYGVVFDGTCTSSPQALDLILTSGPDIMMSPSLEACNSLILNNINILFQSGNQAYYDMPGGMGNQIPVGTIFTGDTVVYAYDEAQGCSDEQRIEITIGQQTDAGMDMTIDTCFNGKLALQNLVPAGADAGTFFDLVGNPILDDTLDIGLLGLPQVMLMYQTTAVLPCPPDEAVYTINVLAANEAGPNNTGEICTGEMIDINTLTFDNGLSGTFEALDGSPINQTTYSMLPNDPPFTIEVLYIVSSSGTCAPDTARIIVQGQEEKNELIDGEVCPDFSVDVFGEIYYSSRPSGSEMGSSVSGCDSIITINLQFRPENRILVDPVLCTGDSLIVDGITYNEGNPTGTEMLLAADENGCDSIIDIDLTFDNEIRTLLDVLICNDMDTVINGVTYSSLNTSGSTTFQSSMGCDSIVEVNVMSNASSNSLVDGNFCPGDTVLVEGEIFDVFRDFGIVELEEPNAAGCDSFVVVQLTFDMSFTEEIDFALCSDRVVDINGTPYGADNPSGMETIENQGSCDSIYLIDLEILMADTLFFDQTYCSDTSIFINGVEYDQSMSQGEEVVTSGSTSGCDQYLLIDLNFVESLSSRINDQVCYGDSVVVNGVTYNSNNPQGQETLLSSLGCDSIVDIDLQVVGIEAEFRTENPDCLLGGGGSLTVDIQSGLAMIEDVILDGISIRDYFVSGLAIEDIAPGPHELVIFSTDGCSIIENFVIEDLDDESLDITSSLREDGLYQLMFEFSGMIDQIRWTPSDGLSCSNCENPEARPTSNTTYKLEVIDVNGCLTTDSIMLSFIAASVIYSPNIFSPNDDGINDIFYVASEGSFEFKEFLIYDRWGNRVHSIKNGLTGDATFGWDGLGYDPGVYIYYIVVDFPDGSQTLSGDVTLMR